MEIAVRSGPDSPGLYLLLRTCCLLNLQAQAVDLSIGRARQANGRERKLALNWFLYALMLPMLLARTTGALF